MLGKRALAGGESIEHLRLRAAEHIACDLKAELEQLRGAIRGESVRIHGVGLLHAVTYWQRKPARTFIWDSLREWLTKCPMTEHYWKDVPTGGITFSQIAALNAVRLSIVEDEAMEFVTELSHRIEARWVSAKTGAVDVR